MSMAPIADYLQADHVHCDRLFADAENAVAVADWQEARALFDRFAADTERHFRREEDTLFPAFETQTGMQAGPTFVMRQEHDQMREVLQAMDEAILRQNSDGYLGLSETLLMLMRQHNLKEEQILYPMCDRALAGQAADLVRKMAAPG